MEEGEGERYEEVEGERHGGSGGGEVWRKWRGRGMEGDTPILKKEWKRRSRGRKRR